MDKPRVLTHPEVVLTTDVKTGVTRRRMLQMLGAGGALAAVGGAYAVGRNRAETVTTTPAASGATGNGVEAIPSTTAVEPSVVTSPTETTATTSAVPNPEIVKPSVEFDLPLDMLPTSADPAEWVARMQELKRLAYNTIRPDLVSFMYYGDTVGNPNEPSAIELERIEWTNQRRLAMPNLEWLINWRLYSPRTASAGANVISVDAEEFATPLYEHHIIDFTILPKEITVKQDGQLTELTIYTIVGQQIYCRYPEFGSDECVLEQ